MIQHAACMEFFGICVSKTSLASVTAHPAVNKTQFKNVDWTIVSKSLIHATTAEWEGQKNNPYSNLWF